jgi:hypothetical protein
MNKSCRWFSLTLLLGELVVIVDLGGSSVAPPCKGSCARQVEASDDEHIDEDGEGMLLSLARVLAWVLVVVMYSTSNMVSV